MLLFLCKAGNAVAYHVRAYLCTAVAQISGLVHHLHPPRNGQHTVAE